MGVLGRWLFVVLLALGVSSAAPAEARPPKPTVKSKPFGKPKTKAKARRYHKPVVKPKPVAKPAVKVEPLVIAPGLPAADFPMPEVGPVPVLEAGDPTMKRPYGCVQKKPRTYPGRVTYACKGEEIAAPGSTATTLTETPIVVPSELVAVFRTCPFEVVPALEAQPDRFIAYEDPDVGRCYMWAPLDHEGLAKIGTFDKRDFLGSVHPYMAAVFLRALAEAGLRGDKLRVINGANPGTKPSWHTFGLAVDVNLAHRKGLGEATRAYLAGGDERRQWLQFAATCERLGLYWLGRRDAGEIFHFEWRPGWTGLPRGEIVTQMQADVAAGGVPNAWRRTRYDDSRPSAFRSLRDPSE